MNEKETIRAIEEIATKKFEQTGLGQIITYDEWVEEQARIENSRREEPAEEEEEAYPDLICHHNERGRARRI